MPNRPRWIEFVTLVFLIAGVGSVALGEPGGARPYKLPPNLPEYFKARYGVPEKNVFPGLLETPNGPHGSLSVNAPMKVPEDTAGDTPLARARSVTHAFLGREAGLLDIPDLAELKEKTDPPPTVGQDISINYQRYIRGVPLDGMWIHFLVAPDGAVSMFQATLVPVPPELYAALGRERLPVEKIQQIVATDLGWPVQSRRLTAGEPGRGENAPRSSLRLTNAQIKEMTDREGATLAVRDTSGIESLTLWAIGKPPYLRWGAFARPPSMDARAGYWIDAFTGEIMQKTGPTPFVWKPPNWEH